MQTPSKYFDEIEIKFEYFLMEQCYNLLALVDYIYNYNSIPKK